MTFAATGAMATFFRTSVGPTSARAGQHAIDLTAHLPDFAINRIR
ncbi:MAG: hypothetical protein ACTHLY_14690 [Pseudolabrys sp.]